MGKDLGYGIWVPDDTDTGNIWDDYLEDNCAVFVAHNHDGVNSPSIAQSRDSSQTIASGAWVDQGDGTYKSPLITMPGSYKFSTFPFIQFVETSGSDVYPQVYPTVERDSDTTFYVYTNDNSLNLTIVFM